MPVNENRGVRAPKHTLSIATVLLSGCIGLLSGCIAQSPERVDVGEGHTLSSVGETPTAISSTANVGGEPMCVLATDPSQTIKARLQGPPTPSQLICPIVDSSQCAGTPPCRQLGGPVTGSNTQVPVARALVHESLQECQDRLSTIPWDSAGGFINYCHALPNGDFLSIVFDYSILGSADTDSIIDVDGDGEIDAVATYDKIWGGKIWVEVDPSVLNSEGQNDRNGNGRDDYEDYLDDPSSCDLCNTDGDIFLNITDADIDGDGIRNEFEGRDPAATGSDRAIYSIGGIVFVENLGTQDEIQTGANVFVVNAEGVSVEDLVAAATTVPLTGHDSFHTKPASVALDLTDPIVPASSGAPMNVLYAEALIRIDHASDDHLTGSSPSDVADALEHYNDRIEIEALTPAKVSDPVHLNSGHVTGTFDIARFVKAAVEFTLTMDLIPAFASGFTSAIGHRFSLFSDAHIILKTGAQEPAINGDLIGAGGLGTVGAVLPNAFEPQHSPVVVPGAGGQAYEPILAPGATGVGYHRFRPILFEPNGSIVLFEPSPTEPELYTSPRHNLALRGGVATEQCGAADLVVTDDRGTERHFQVFSLDGMPSDKVPTPTGVPSGEDRTYIGKLKRVVRGREIIELLYEGKTPEGFRVHHPSAMIYSKDRVPRASLRFLYDTNQWISEIEVYDILPPELGGPDEPTLTSRTLFFRNDRGLLVRVVTDRGPSPIGEPVDPEAEPNEVPGPVEVAEAFSFGWDDRDLRFDPDPLTYRPDNQASNALCLPTTEKPLVARPTFIAYPQDHASGAPGSIPFGQTVYFSRDVEGRVIEAKAGHGENQAVHRITYTDLCSVTACGKLAEVEKDGRLDRYVFDEEGRLTSMAVGDNTNAPRVTTYTYTNDEDTQPSEVWHPDGSLETFTRNQSDSTYLHNKVVHRRVVKGGRSVDTFHHYDPRFSGLGPLWTETRLTGEPNVLSSARTYLVAHEFGLVDRTAVGLKYGVSSGDYTYQTARDDDLNGDGEIGLNGGEAPLAAWRQDSVHPEQQETLRYDFFGRPVWTQSAGGVPSTFTYDDAGEIQTTTLDPEGEALVTRVTRSCRPWGAIETTIAPGGARVEVWTDTLGRVHLTRAYGVPDPNEPVPENPEEDPNIRSTSRNYYRGRKADQVTYSETEYRDGRKVVTRNNYNDSEQLSRTEVASYNASGERFLRTENRSERDLAGRVIHREDERGISEDVTYTAFHEPHVVTKNIGTSDELVTTTTHMQSGPALGAVHTVIAPDETLTTYSYDAQGRVETEVVVAPDGSGTRATTRYLEDHVLDLVEQSLLERREPGGPWVAVGGERFTYDAAHNFTRQASYRIVYPFGDMSTTVDYLTPVATACLAAGCMGEVLVEFLDRDEQGRVWRTTAADGSYVEVDYDTWGTVGARYHYTAASQLLSFESIDYDRAHAKPSQTVTTWADGTTTMVTTEYNADGNPVLYETYEDGVLNDRVQNRYDDEGRKIETTNRREGHVVTRYGLDGRPNEVVDFGFGGAPPRSTFLEYDAEGRQHRTIDDAGSVVEKTFDRFNRQTMTTYADGSFERYDYDRFGRVLTVTRPNGELINYDYNLAGRLTAIRYPEEATGEDGTCSVFFHPDVVSGASETRTVSRIDGALVTVIETQSRGPFGGVEGTQEVRIRDKRLGDVLTTGRVLARDVRGKPLRVQKVSVDGGPVVQRIDYEDQLAGYGQIKTVRCDTGGCGADRDYAYDLRGRNTVETVGRYTKEVLSRDLNRVTANRQSFDGSVLKERNFGWDFERSLIDSVADALGGPGSASHQFDYNTFKEVTWYDQAGTPRAGVEDLGYSSTQGIETRTESLVGGPAVTTTYQHDAFHRPTAVTSGGLSSSVQYDENGGRRSDDRYNYRFDARKRVVEIEAQGGGYANHFAYDAAGNLVLELRTEEGASSWVRHTYAGGQRIRVAAYDSADLQNATMVQRHGYGRGGLLTVDSYDAQRGETQLLVERSWRGDVIGLRDAKTGTLLEERGYSLFGERTVRNLSGQDIPPTVRAGFAGGWEVTPEGDLTVHGARVFDAKNGVFVSPDPLAERGVARDGAGIYAYGRNNPVMLADPSGHFATLAGSFMEGGGGDPPCQRQGCQGCAGCSGGSSVELVEWGPTDRFGRPVGLDQARFADGLRRAADLQRYREARQSRYFERLTRWGFASEGGRGYAELHLGSQTANLHFPGSDGPPNPIELPRWTGEVFVSFVPIVGSVDATNSAYQDWNDASGWGKAGLVGNAALAIVSEIPIFKIFKLGKAGKAVSGTAGLSGDVLTAGGHMAIPTVTDLSGVAPEVAQRALGQLDAIRHVNLDGAYSGIENCTDASICAIRSLNGNPQVANRTMSAVDHNDFLQGLGSEVITPASGFVASTDDALSLLKNTPGADSAAHLFLITDRRSGMNHMMIMNNDGLLLDAQRGFVTTIENHRFGYIFPIRGTP